MSANDETRTAVPDSDPEGTGTHSPPGPDGTASHNFDPDAPPGSPAERAPPPPTDARGLAVPGFAIESEIDHGGMGVVYRATQIGLNRVVALKMLIAGPFAKAVHRARFLLEAESVAALEHPHIVRVFAFGESGGHPYLAMEFVPGGTLAARVERDGPLPAKGAADLLAKLADAVAHAHSRGVVHRDIKPGNVLLTAEGEPRLADFGLAKVGRSDLSMTGQVLGTPAYMSPEQAAGKVHEVGTAADVYALGAVFYEVLTGRPPFTGDSAAVTLQKVLTEEPARPRSLNASIPRDLETICLKCLEKQPAKRYPTAQALADDLRRHLRGEPISVRPTGALERGVKWVKRNKAASGAMAAVSLALLAGSGVSLGFGLEARRQATVADTQKQNALDAAERERDAAASADRERREAVAARADLKRTLVKALLGPITARDPHLELTPYEREAFWQIAGLRGNEVTWALIEEATRSPLARDQLVNRVEYVLHAVVGLDPNRRDEVERLLLARVRPEPDGRPELGLVLASARWDGRSQPLKAATAEALLAALRKETSANMRGKLAWHLSAVAARMEPAEAAKVCGPAVEILAAALEKESDEDAGRRLARGLGAVASRLEPNAAAKVLLEALADKIHDPFICAELVPGLTAVTTGLEPDAASAAYVGAAEQLVRGLRFGKASRGREQYARSFQAVAERVRPGAAPELWSDAAIALTANLNNETDYSARAALADCLAAVAAQMEPADAVRILTIALRKATDSYARSNLASGLLKATERMAPTEAVRVLTDTLNKNPASLARLQLSLGLAAVASPTAAINVLAVSPKQDPEVSDSVELARGLVLISARMEPTAAVNLLSAVLTRETDTLTYDVLATGLAAVGARMEPAEAAKVRAMAADTLLTTLTRETKVFHCCWLARGLAKVAEQMEPAAAAKACATAADNLLNRLNQEIRPDERGDLGEGLAALAARMEPTAAAKVCTTAADHLLTAFNKVADDSKRWSLANGLGALAARMEPTVAVDQLSTLLSKEPDTTTRQTLATHLSGLATAERPPEVRAAVVQALTAALDRETDVETRSALAATLLELVARTGPTSAGGVVAKALDAFDLTEYPFPLSSIEQANDPFKAVGSTRQSLGRSLSEATRGMMLDDSRWGTHAISAMTGAFATPHNLFPSLSLLHPHYHPQPRPLPPQELVELLKHPLCVEQARRAVLDALEFTYSRKFKGHWEFVEYAQKHQPQLDLLSPPKRPERP